MAVQKGRDILLKILGAGGGFGAAQAAAGLGQHLQRAEPQAEGDDGLGPPDRHLHVAPAELADLDRFQRLAGGAPPTLPR